jgi:pimeloyl-ACP methyl ester carboxylesterase
VGGASLGANVSLEVVDAAPDRVLGLILEMPVLDNTLETAIFAFGPLMYAARFAPLGFHVIRRTTKAVPRGLVPFWPGIILDTLDQRPDTLRAVLHGIIQGRLAPPGKRRMAIEVPALIIGHPHDPIHQHVDAEMLAEEIPDSRHVGARSILEWRYRPKRLTDIAIGFVDDCFEEPSHGRRLQGT